MAIEFECDCGRRLRVKEEKAGRKVRCPDCSSALTVPTVSKSAVKKARNPPKRSAAKPRSSAPRNLPAARSAKKPKSKGRFSEKERWVAIGAFVALTIATSIMRYRIKANQPRPPARQTERIPAVKPPKKSPVERLEEAALLDPAAPEGATRVFMILDYEQYGDVSDGFLRRLGARTGRVSYKDEMLKALLENTEVSEVATKISHGKIIKVDTATRTILVDASPSSPSDSAFE